MNEQRIREVIEIERQAQDMLAAAKQEAEQLPVQAEREAQEIIEKARASARAEAQKIVEQAQAGRESTDIMSKAQQKMTQHEQVAERNIEKAVLFILERVLGRA